jgi:patatin-like phospholipase/acyl hydrolase
MPENTGVFQILSLDGGGMKGIFSAAFLAAIEDDFGICITDHFDLIAGTSTGGIVALGLGLGMRPREILEFYLSWGRKIFASRFGLRSVQQWIIRKFPVSPLEEALRSTFGDKRLGDSRKRLVIPSYNIGENDVYVFRTPHHLRLGRDLRVPAWKIGLATAAAPTYFPCFRGIDSVRLIDGGVWANNPAMVALVEAYGTLAIPLSAIRMLSIGTTDVVHRRRSRLNHGGILPWAFGNAAIDAVMRGQSIAANNQAGFLLGAENLERVNPAVTQADYSLDGLRSARDLIGKASYHSRRISPTFAAKFGGHAAGPYIPFHQEQNHVDAHA